MILTDMVKEFAYEIIGKGRRLYNRCSFPLQHNDKIICIFNTAIGTDNLGDYIIMHYCNQILHELFGDCKFTNISTHQVPTETNEDLVKQTKFKFVCGTNLLTSHIEEWWNWRLPDGFRKKLNYRNSILLGIGWGNYQDECSSYSKMIYRSMLNSNLIHSVRDTYTEKKLKAAGITNVINTGCPTMWRLTPAFCRSIPTQKARDVITTITDYRRDIEKDNQMFRILSRNYRNVYLWLQGKNDKAYLSQFDVPENLVIIPRSIEAYEEKLSQGNIDYVGTRLHAGIFALNHSIRSIIIAVDNRAIEIAKDTNIPLILREDLEYELEKLILDNWQTEIQIKEDNISKFKNQFLS